MNKVLVKDLVIGRKYRIEWKSCSISGSFESDLRILNLKDVNAGRYQDEFIFHPNIKIQSNSLEIYEV